MDLFEIAVELEREANLLSEYYLVSCKPKPSKKPLSPVQEVLRGYKHEDALRFATAAILFNSGASDIYSTRNVSAYYRVMEEKGGKYILEACHVNVHGDHNGDLRFIEVNEGTAKRGDAEKSKWFGKLFPGDLVTVTELKKLKEFEPFPVSESSHDLPCVWMASVITVLPRNILENVTFSLLENGTAVVQGETEVMNVILSKKHHLQVGKLYEGTCFVPVKFKWNYTSDHRKDLENKIIKACSKIHASPNHLGTIFESRDAPELSEMFHIGWDAYKPGHLFKPPDVIELCVLMGYSAAVSISNGRNDSRSFPMRHIERKGDFLEFTIENPEENPTDGKWMIKTKIKIRGADQKSLATIESVIPQGPRKLRIVARLSRDVKKNRKFTHGVHVVSQQEGFELEGLNDGFFEKKLPHGSNGRRILEALYGGKKITYKVPDMINQCCFHGIQHRIQLNVFQCCYVHMLMDRIPMVVGSSPFGRGKSMTIVTAAQDIYKRNPNQKQLLITQSNYASVNLVDIASKLDADSRFTFVRYLSEKNYMEFPEECLTEHDMQHLMKILFSSWAKGEITSKQLKPRDLERMLNFVLYRKLVDPGNLSGEALAMYSPEKIPRKPYTQDLRLPYFILHKPDVIMITADSLISLLNSKLLKAKQVSTIQIDEASQLPEHTLIRLLTQFPHANYGLIGDIQQLPPYCETGLDGKLKDYGIGNTMERAVKEKLFPQAMLREVYRCHPKITKLLSRLFYDGKLISGITEKDRSEFMLGRSDFWPQSRFPVLIVNNENRGNRMGTSCGNKSEVQIVKDLLKVLTQEHNGYQHQPSKIGVISFYAAQTSVLTEALRGQKVKCGTVDAFQGTERDVIILCCTNEKISEFMQLSNRINVAMSRAKQVTIIVGNVEGLKMAKYWCTIVRKAERKGCIVEPESFRTVYLDSKTGVSSDAGKIKSAEQQLLDNMNDFSIKTGQKCAICRIRRCVHKFSNGCPHKQCTTCLLARETVCFEIYGECPICTSS